jgi:hypothetical protein
MKELPFGIRMFRGECLPLAGLAISYAAVDRLALTKNMPD